MVWARARLAKKASAAMSAAKRIVWEITLILYIIQTSRQPQLLWLQGKLD